MRIASLVPSATEALFALGLGDQVVAVTHECDHPADVRSLPRLTASVLPPNLTAAEIDVAVRETIGRGEALYTLDERLLAKLDVDLIVTQGLCAVCAVSYDDVRRIAARLPSRPAVLSLDPVGLDDVLDDLVRLAEAAGEPSAGLALRGALTVRLDNVRQAVADAERVRVVALEWLDPPYVGGHWVPEMIRIAGGVDPIARPGERSRVVPWSELATTQPEVAIVMPCGLYTDEAVAEADQHRSELECLAAQQVFAVDAASSFSRPGPRLVDGVELLGHLLHPDRVAAPPGIGWQPVLSRIESGPGQPH